MDCLPGRQSDSYQLHHPVLPIYRIICDFQEAFVLPLLSSQLRGIQFFPSLLSRPSCGNLRFVSVATFSVSESWRVDDGASLQVLACNAKCIAASDTTALMQTGMDDEAGSSCAPSQHRGRPIRDGGG